MHMIKVLVLFLVLLCCELCATIKVPVTWDSVESEVKNGPLDKNPVHPTNKPRMVHVTRSYHESLTPNEYFQYTAQKPEFAANIAAFHGVQNPEQHYKAYPVIPFTGKVKPNLGIHYILDGDKGTYRPLQNYVHKNVETFSQVKPTTSNYEVFHPYEAEKPALQEIYKDPVLTKIRDYLNDQKKYVESYEKQAGESNIAKSEYIESPQKTENKLFPHKSVPAQYEIHNSERRPLYFQLDRPSMRNNRNHKLNNKFKHPFNENAKVKPKHYYLLHKRIKNLRQHHATKFDDERNEYPQLAIPENIADDQDGYDIYEKGKQKFIQLRNNLDESITKVSQQNQAPTYQKLELQKQESGNEDKVIEEDFVPIKNYAQVRKTETFKHLPKKSAFDDAETQEEIINAPRLREAVKSTKAQTVYTEEGYEDSAYDHAGEHKYASDHEGHGGFLKEHENSAGLYKIPSVTGNHEDGGGSEYRNHKEHGKKWKNKDENEDEETENEDYSEIEDSEDESNDTDIRKKEDVDILKDNDAEPASRYKRQGLSYKDNDAIEDDVRENGNIDENNDNENKTEGVSYGKGAANKINNSIQLNTQPIPSGHHAVDKRELKLELSDIKYNTTLLNKNLTPKRTTDYKKKYPYYFKNITGIPKHSPLRYAENLKLIPRKSQGGTEFYDSKSQLECPEVDDNVDPVPEKLKSGENPTDENDENIKSKETEKFETIKQQPRLKGLGDKIDCFKNKYFGADPLDSPFFTEDIISNPEPIFVPKISSFNQGNIEEEIAQESQKESITGSLDKLNETTKTNTLVVLDKLRSNPDSSLKGNTSVDTPLLLVQVNNNTQQDHIYTDILKTIEFNTDHFERKTELPANLLNFNTNDISTKHNIFLNNEKKASLPPKLRKIRAAPFVYEPYKIIRDSQVQDSKKTTTSSNISPLIKQLQLSGVADRVSRSNRDDKQVKQKTNSRTYVDIGRRDREKTTFRNENDNIDATFVDVSIDQRRGEPRYELRPLNHKSEYTPIENRKSMSVDAYKSHKNTESNMENITEKPTRGRRRFWFLTSTTTTTPLYDDLSQIIPKNADHQNVAASNSVKKTVVDVTSETVTKKQENIKENSGKNIDYEEYEDEDYGEDVIITTTSMAPKPLYRKRMKTTEKIPEYTTQSQRLKLVTRFRNFKPEENSEFEELATTSVVNNPDDAADVTTPQYREKKRKSHTSTIVTDTQKYGDADDDDDMRKEEVDSMIGVNTDMDEYIPTYEKKEKSKERLNRNEKLGKKDDKMHRDIDSDNVSVNGDEDNEDNDEDEDENYENYDEEDDDIDDESEDLSEEDEKGEKLEAEPETTTPEPTKRTLVRTTDAPPSTIASRIRTYPVSPQLVRPDTKPFVIRKRTEIHKELPLNKSSHHSTQFKEDIKEVEIIKEMPKLPKRPMNHVLDLYKDDDLAEQINNLGDVEIFEEEFDLDRAPRHGGNYQKATKEVLKLLKPLESSTETSKDAQTSQSKNMKHFEPDMKSFTNTSRRKNSGSRSELIDLSKPTVTGMHGGNLKHENTKRGSRKNEKLVELDENNDEGYSSEQDDDYKSPNTRKEKMHGGNYRSAKLVASNENSDDIRVKSAKNNSRGSSAVLLNSFAQVIPILTSTPGYILDPSKRMYYYVNN